MVKDAPDAGIEKSLMEFCGYLELVPDGWICPLDILHTKLVIADFKIGRKEGYWIKYWSQLPKDYQRLFDDGALNLEEASIDGSFAPAKKGGQKLEKQRRVKALKLWQLQRVTVFAPRIEKYGIEMIAPHKGNRKKKVTQDMRRLSLAFRTWSFLFFMFG